MDPLREPDEDNKTIFASVTCANCKKLIRVPEAKLRESVHKQLFLCQPCKLPEVLKNIQENYTKVAKEVMYHIKCSHCENHIKIALYDWRGRLEPAHTCGGCQEKTANDLDLEVNIKAEDVMSGAEDDEDMQFDDDADKTLVSKKQTGNGK